MFSKCTHYLVSILLCMPFMLCSLGVTNGFLTPCDNRWNCVVTQSINGKKPSLAPIYYTIERRKALEFLKKVLEQFERVTWILETENYIHVTFTSRVWGFIDDIEFYFPEEEKVIHMRSASRLGKYDLGVNKRRLKKIKKLFYKFQQ